MPSLTRILHLTVLAALVLAALTLPPGRILTVSAQPLQKGPLVALVTSTGQLNVTADLNEQITLLATGVRLGKGDHLLIVSKHIKKKQAIKGKGVAECGDQEDQCLATESAATEETVTYYAGVVGPLNGKEEVLSVSKGVTVAWKDLKLDVYVKDLYRLVTAGNTTLGDDAPQTYSALPFASLQLHVNVPAGFSSSWETLLAADDTGASFDLTCDATPGVGVAASCTASIYPQAPPAGPTTAQTRTYAILAVGKDSNGKLVLKKKSALITVNWDALSLSISPNGFAGNPIRVPLGHRYPDAHPGLDLTVSLGGDAATAVDLAAENGAVIYWIPGVIDETTQTRYPTTFGTDQICKESSCVVTVPAPSDKSTHVYRPAVMLSPTRESAEGDPPHDLTVKWGSESPCGPSTGFASHLRDQQTSSPDVCLFVDGAHAASKTVGLGTEVKLSAETTDDLGTTEHIEITRQVKGKAVETLTPNCPTDSESGVTTCEITESYTDPKTVSYTASIKAGSSAVATSDPATITWAPAGWTFDPLQQAITATTTLCADNIHGNCAPHQFAVSTKTLTGKACGADPVKDSWYLSATIVGQGSKHNPGYSSSVGPTRIWSQPLGTNGSVTTSNPNDYLNLYLGGGYGNPPDTVSVSIDTSGASPALHVDVTLGQPTITWDTGPMETDTESPAQFHLVAPLKPISGTCSVP